jgi:TolA-binding protein
MPVIMESLFLLVIVATIALCAAVWGTTRWWYRRQFRAWARRIDKADRKLQVVALQSMQMRKQVEKLQRELSEARRAAAVASSQLGSQHPRPLAPAAAASPERKPSPNNGFADTMPM